MIAKASILNSSSQVQICSETLFRRLQKIQNLIYIVKETIQSSHTSGGSRRTPSTYSFNSQSIKYKDLGSSKPLLARSNLVQNWLAGVEAKEVQQMIFHGNSSQPTEAGIVLLRKAEVRPQDIILLDLPQQKNYPVRSPTVEQRINKTLALLKVAEVIAKEKFDKQCQIERQKNLLDKRLGFLNITNAKIMDPGSPASGLNSKFLNRRRIGRSHVKGNKRDTMSLKAAAGCNSPALKPQNRKLLVRNARKQPENPQPAGTSHTKGSYPQSLDQSFEHNSKTKPSASTMPDQNAALEIDSIKFKNQTRSRFQNNRKKLSNSHGQRVSEKTDQSLKISDGNSCFSETGKQLIHHKLPNRDDDDGIESIRASSMSESSVSASSFSSDMMSRSGSVSSLGSLKKLEPSRFMKGNRPQQAKASQFQKKMLNDKLDKIKAYRKQFEDDDNSFKSFKPKKSGSPMTPKESLKRKDFLIESMVAAPTDSPFAVDELPVAPVRQFSDLGPILKDSFLNGRTYNDRLSHQLD